MAAILVVDDERDISEAVRAILEDEGHVVTVCGDGREAADFLSRGHQIDLVISDVMMPRMSGLELLEQIRKARNGAPTVILMSGVNPTRTRSTAKWDDFIKKPFNLDTLLDTVNRQLRR